jgi:hypothetical protein
LYFIPPFALAAVARCDLLDNSPGTLHRSIAGYPRLVTQLGA